MSRANDRADLLVIGAGPAGIALVAEARAAGVPAGRIVVLEKAEAHSWIVRKYYPEGKPVLATYKGLEPVCHGVLCIPDLTREETLSYLDRAITESGVQIDYGEEVQSIHRSAEGIFRVTSSGGVRQARVVVVAIGILGRPKKPSYPIPKEVQDRVRYDVTSEEMVGLRIVVVGGGDTATEYCQFLVEKANQVDLSYRGTELTRPNPINRESIRALVERGSLRLWLASNVRSVEAAGQRVQVHFEEQGIGPLEVDRIVYALGGTTPENFLRSAGIHFDGEWPKLGEGFSTSVPALYLAGDLTAGRTGGSIIQAFNSAGAAMRRICVEHGICRI